MTAYYERLSHLDASFLALESRSTHMHVGGIALFDAAPLTGADGGIDIDRIRTFIGSRLHLIPRYRQRLAHVPLERHPVWVDDEHFNLDYHVRFTALPKPGSMELLKAQAARLASQQLDREKPLWELYVVEGVAGNRFAIVSKIHHCMIDGIAGVDLLAVMLNTEPVAEIEEEDVPFAPRPAPTSSELLVRETARRAGAVVAAARSARRAIDDVKAVAAQGVRRVRAVAHSLGSGWLTVAPKTPLNGKVSPIRRFETLDTDLSAVKEIKNALRGSVNDVLLATVAGGIRRFFLDVRGFDVEGVPLRAMAPVSVRTRGQRGSLGNQVAMWLVSLPIDDPDPVSRLAKVTAETLKLKKTDQALGASTIVQISAGAPATLVSLASRLAAGARPFNLTVTNVPGPQFPLYLLEAPLLAQYPLVPLWESHGVGIAMFSYNGVVCWGFNADWDIMPDVARFAECMRDSLDELLRAAREPAAPAKPAPRKRTTPKPRPPLGTR